MTKTEYVDVDGKNVETVAIKDGSYTFEENTTEVDKQQSAIKEIAEETGLHGQWEDIVINCPKCNSSDNVYLYVDQKTCYCLECTAEFDIADAFPNLDDDTYTFSSEDIETGITFDADNDNLEDREVQTRLAAQLVSDDPAEVKKAMELLEMAKPDAKKYIGKQIADNQTKNYKPTGFQGGYQGTYNDWQSYKNICTHRPQHIIAGEGWGVWAGKKEDVRDSLQNYDIVMNLTYTSVKDVHIIPIPELAKWADYGHKFVEIQMDWADYGTINLPVQFWRDLVEHIKEKKLKLLIFCQGGHGRTGTALACLFTVALGYKPAEAIQWVRKNYCHEAIETKGQEAYVLSMALPEPVPEILEAEIESPIQAELKSMEVGK